MQYQRHAHRSHPSLTASLVGLVVAAGVVALPAGAAGTCPSNFECRPRLEILLAQGMEQSPSLHSLVETLASHPGVELNLVFSRQRSGKRAQSDLAVNGYYANEDGAIRRKVTGVTGTVTIPYVAYGHDQIALIAHELDHVLDLLNGISPKQAQAMEQEVVDFEKLVLAELDASRARVGESR